LRAAGATRTAAAIRQTGAKWRVMVPPDGGV
jgi:hypothetical protein